MSESKGYLRESLVDWRKSHDLGQAPLDLQPNDPVFIPDEQNLFIEAKIKKILPGNITVQVDSEEKTLPKASIFVGGQLGREGIEDMVQIQFLHEPLLVRNLEIRFEARRVYTYIGSILLSVNPYKTCPIYTPAIIRMYQGKPVGTLPPHIFAIADSAYSTMRSEFKNQSILISGESGSGKTEGVKLILNYLTAISGKDKKASHVKVTPQERILSSNPVLEAFGNAKTAKMCDILFDDTGYIVGGRVKQYLLEKSRVVRQSRGERNFHAFYYLLAGCDKTERAVWGVYDAKHYRYTNQTRVYEIPGINSRLEYVALKRAMTVCGISVDHQHIIFTLLAAILHLGNIRFSGDEVAQIKNSEVLKWVSHLLKCDVKLLTEALLYKDVTVGDESELIPLTAQAANDTRDTLAKELYGRCFEWICNRVNDDMDCRNFARMISLLDIFGFEQYEVNAFEQFCINYANERLQLEFNEHIFRREMEEYLTEQLDVSKFTFEDNQPALELIERQPGGILDLIDIETKSIEGDDSTLLAKILTVTTMQDKSQIEFADQPVFCVQHYAGEVAYTVTGFLDTNRERFSHSLIEAMKSSRIEFFVDLFKELGAMEKIPIEKRPSLSGQFKVQLAQVMTVLNEGTPQYVRCLKPNKEQSSEIYDRHDMLRQIRHTGVMETVRIRKEGYPFRRPHVEFLDRYGMLAEFKRSNDAAASIQALMLALNIDRSRFQIGATKVFIKDEVHHQLEGSRANYYNGAATKIQALLKGFVCRKRYLTKVAATHFLQKWVSLYLAAVDCSQEITGELKVLAGVDGSRKVSALQKVRELAGRQANIDVIVDRGGIGSILHTIDDEKAESDLYVAGTTALTQMASKADASMSIARGGGVKSMVKNIDTRPDLKEQPHSIQLLGDLSKQQKNLGIVIREGGLEALTRALTRNTRVDVITDTQVSAAAMALGELSKNVNVQRVIGRDHNAIKAVIEGIQQKPKYARLTEYSINCIANMAQSRDNVDSIVELGGIETLMMSMKLHKGNENILKEIARTFAELGKNPMYAKMIGEVGGLDLAMGELQLSPDHSGQYALEIIQALCSHPANTTRFLKNGGINILLSILKSGIQNDAVLSLAMRLIAALSQDSVICTQILEADGAHIVLESLNANPDYHDHDNYALMALLNFGQVDRDTFHFLKTSGVVVAVAQAMERFAASAEVLDSGKACLAFLADNQDIKTAMDVVGTSRMKKQSEKVLLETGISIVVISGMALIEEHVDFIIGEAGVSILLDVVNGTSVNVSSKVADQVLVPAVRALSRLLVDEENIEAFCEGGGVSSLVSAIQGQSDKERVSAVCVAAFDRLMDNQKGFSQMRLHGGIEAIISILAEHCEFEGVTLSILELLVRLAQSKADGVQLLVERGCLEAAAHVLTFYQNKPRLLVPTVALLRLLATSPEVDPGQLNICVESLLAGLRISPEEASLAREGLMLIEMLSKDPASVGFLQEKKAVDVILTLLDQHYGNAEITSLASAILRNITGNKELVEALGLLKEQSEKLLMVPTDTDLMAQMILPTSLIGSMSSSPEEANVIVANQGFAIISQALHATKGAKACLAQERLSKHIAVTIGPLGNHKKHLNPLIVSGTVENLMQSVDHFIDYEEFVEETENTLDILSRNPEAINYLIESGAGTCVTSMVQAHPLNDGILISATRLITRLAKGAPVKHLANVRNQGAALAMVAIQRFINTEDHLIDALSSMAQLASLTEDGNTISLTGDSARLFESVLQKHNNSPGVMTAAASAFTSLAEDRDFAKMFVNEGLLEEIMRGLENFGDNEEFCARALSVIYKLALVPDNIPILAEMAIPALTLEIMARHASAEHVQSEGLLVLTALSVNEDLSKFLANSGAIRQAFNGVRAHPMAPLVVTHGIAFAYQLAKVAANHPKLTAEKTKQMVQWAMRAYPQNMQLQTLCRRCLALIVHDPAELKQLQETPILPQAAVELPGGVIVEEEEESALVIQSLNELMQIIRDPETPAKQLAIAFMGIANMKASSNAFDRALKHGGLNRMVEILEESFENLSLLLPLLKCLVKFVEKPEHINLLVAYGGVGALIQAMKRNMGVPDVLTAGSRILGKLSAYNRLKVLIGLHGGIPLLLDIMEKYLALAPLLNKCAYCLGNLASNCLPNRAAIIRGGGVNFISFAMQKHRSWLDLVINCARALSPLCADDDQSCLTVAKGGGSIVVVRAIMHHPDNPALLQNGLNCLHKISKRNETLPTLVHQGAVQAVSASMLAFPDNAELQLFAMEILSNLSTSQSKETAAQLLQGGTIETVIKSATAHSQNTRIQTAAYICLQHLAAVSEQDAKLIITSGFGSMVATAMGDSKTQEKQLIEGLKLLEIVVSNEMNAALVLQETKVADLFISIVQICADKRDVVQKALIGLSKLSTTREHAQILALKGAVVAVVEAVLDRGDDTVFVMDSLRVMVNLAILEENAITLSQTAVEPLIKCVDNNFTNQSFLRLFFLLMSNISMWPRASKHLIDQGFVPIIVVTMKASLNFPAVVVKMIKVLTNFTLVGEQAKKIIVDAGALVTVREMAALHRNHIQLTKAAEYFIFKISGSQRRTVLESEQDFFAFVEEKLPLDTRNLLTAGQLFRRFANNGSAKDTIISVSLDFEYIICKEPKSNEQTSLPLKVVKDVLPGACTPGLVKKKFGIKKANPAHSFAVFDMRDAEWVLSLEAPTAKDAAQWVAALQHLKEIYTSFQVGV